MRAAYHTLEVAREGSPRKDRIVSLWGHIHTYTDLFENAYLLIRFILKWSSNFISSNIGKAAKF